LSERLDFQLQVRPDYVLLSTHSLRLQRVGLRMENMIVLTRHDIDSRAFSPDDTA